MGADGAQGTDADRMAQQATAPPRGPTDDVEGVPTLSARQTPGMTLPGVSTPAAITAITPGGQTRSVKSSNRASRAGTPPELKIEEQAILANIQELQRQLVKVKAAQDQTGEPKEGPKDDKQKGPLRRVIIVANRLPVTGKRDPKTGDWSFRMSSGGLVTALKGSREEMRAVWIGWLGQEIPPEEREKVAQQLLKEHNAVPVFISDALANKYYNGFSNDVLWPLFHYVPLPMYQANAHQNARFDNTLWEAYKEANVQFAEAVAEVSKEDDYIWIQDYHLMWLPLELRKRTPKANIGWFLHTPFPSSEIYRILPERKELLEALLCSDLVGFHTYDYARHFLSACNRVLGIPTAFKGLEYNNHFTSLGVFPIGIDPDHVTNMLQKKEVHTRIRELMETFKGRKLLLGVDRLDYIKGMPHKMLAFERFLTNYPEWRGKVTLIQVGVPSRTEVHEYQKLAERVNELVGRINGTFGTLDYTPVHYLFKSVTQDELFSIYNLADVCLVTSLRDGMNLVSYEYVASQIDIAGFETHKDGPGVLVLSELAGSAESMPGAIRINPWNTEEVCVAIEEALTMSRSEREIRHAKLLRFVHHNTAAWWARTFVKEMKNVCSDKRSVHMLPDLPTQSVKEAYEQASRRLIVAEYDSLLLDLQSLPQLSRPSDYLTKLLGTLAKDYRNTLVIISSHEKRYLENWLGHLKTLVLAAECGFYCRMPQYPGDDSQDAGAWKTMLPELDNTWMDLALPIIEYFTERTPGTYVEKKSCSLAWYYRDADPNFGSWQAKDLQMQLDRVLFGVPVQVIQSDHMIEIRHRDATTAMLVENVLRHMHEESKGDKACAPPVDFILCVSGDQTHDDMFSKVKNLHRAAVDPSFALSSASPRSRPPSQPASPLINKHKRSQQRSGVGEPALSPSASISKPSPNTDTAPSTVSPHTGQSLVSPSPPTPRSSSFSNFAFVEPLMSKDTKVFAVHVGKGQSSADYNLEGAQQVRRLFLDLASTTFRCLSHDATLALQRMTSTDGGFQRMNSQDGAALLGPQTQQ